MRDCCCSLQYLTLKSRLLILSIVFFFAGTTPHPSLSPSPRPKKKLRVAIPYLDFFLYSGADQTSSFSTPLSPPAFPRPLELDSFQKSYHSPISIRSSARRSPCAVCERNFFSLSLVPMTLPLSSFYTKRSIFPPAWFTRVCFKAWSTLFFAFRPNRFSGLFY